MDAGILERLAQRHPEHAVRYNPSELRLPRACPASQHVLTLLVIILGRPVRIRLEAFPPRLERRFSGGLIARPVCGGHWSLRAVNR